MLASRYGVLQRRAFKQVSREKFPIIITVVQVRALMHTVPCNKQMSN